MQTDLKRKSIFGGGNILLILKFGELYLNKGKWESKQYSRNNG
jgi:hypothetical protein